MIANDGLDQAWGAAPKEDAIVQIDLLHEQLVVLMKKGQTESFTQKEAFLSPVLEKIFDFDYMVKSLIGRRWQKLTPEDQLKLRKTFKDLTVATYVSRFKKYSGEVFTTIGKAEGPKESYWVNTAILTAEKKEILLNYLMHPVAIKNNNNQSMIVDVFLNGTISEFATRRSEYRSILKRSGVGELIQILDKKIQSFRK